MIIFFFFFFFFFGGGGGGVGELGGQIFKKNRIFSLTVLGNYTQDTWGYLLDFARFPS